MSKEGSYDSAIGIDQQLLFAKLTLEVENLSTQASKGEILGLLIDYISVGAPSQTLLSDTIQSLATSLCMTAISSSAGLLIGVATSSILVGVILVIYGANQISAIATLLPNMVEMSNPIRFTIILGSLISRIFLVVAIFLFARKEF